MSWLRLLVTHALIPWRWWTLDLHSALQWLSDMQFNNVDVETDSKLTCDAFHATQNDTSELWCIISSCRFLFSSFFTKFRVEFVRRQANGVPHIIAREVTLLVSLVVYFNIPDCIEHISFQKKLNRLAWHTW